MTSIQTSNDRRSHGRKYEWKFLNDNRQRFDRYPGLPLAGVAVAGTMGGKATRLSKQIYADMRLQNTIM